MFFIALVAPFIGALATFYTGFGLNTILVPIFMIYWDAPLAVMMAGLVHLANNLVKVSLTAKSIDWHLFRYFGIPAILFAFIGAFLLKSLNDAAQLLMAPIFGAILILFAVLEFFKWRLPLKANWSLGLGGVLSGFFGGFSGHQGALRSMFLSKLELNPLVFVASTAIISLLIDITRIGVYFSGSWLNGNYSTFFVLVGVPAAITGTLIGRKYIEKVNHKNLSKIVGFALFCMGVSMVFGWVK